MKSCSNIAAGPFVKIEERNAGGSWSEVRTYYFTTTSGLQEISIDFTPTKEEVRLYLSTSDPSNSFNPPTALYFNNFSITDGTTQAIVDGGIGSKVAFKYRIHDARIGRFLSIDPLTADYPWNSPYAFSENIVINAVELEGLEKEFVFDRLYNLDGRNKDMPIGLIEHKPYAPARGESGLPIVNNTDQAIQHYFKGGGETVELGPDVQTTLRNSDRVNSASNNLRNGTTSLPAGGDGALGVNVAFDGAFFVGRIGLTYETTCADGNCTTRFTLDDEGFVDPNYLSPFPSDNEGPNAELPGGTTFDFQPYTFEETYPNPGYPVDENGRPSAIPQEGSSNDKPASTQGGN